MNYPHDPLVQCFSAVFPELSAGEIPRASMTSVGRWDSITTVTLVSVVEEEFGIDVAPDDLELFVSFELILDYLLQQQRSARVS